jgi:hypothetical protein
LPPAILAHDHALVDIGARARIAPACVSTLTQSPAAMPRRRTQRGTWRLGNLSTPDSVQKLQAALHAKAKAEPGYRFYALYDKISREDILAHAYAQCRSNKGAPGVDRQDFEAIEAYGV